MMVNAYPNDIDDRRGHGVKFFWHLYRPSLICATNFILIEETSTLLPRLLSPRFYRIPTLFTRSSKYRRL